MPGDLLILVGMAFRSPRGRQITDSWKRKNCWS